MILASLFSAIPPKPDWSDGTILTPVWFISRPCGEEPIEDISKGDAPFPARKTFSAVFSSLSNADKTAAAAVSVRWQSLHLLLWFLLASQQPSLLTGNTSDCFWRHYTRGGCLAPDLLVPKIDRNMFLYFSRDGTSQREEAAEQSRLPSGSCADLSRRSLFTFWQSGMSSATWRRRENLKVTRLPHSKICHQRGVDRWGLLGWIWRHSVKWHKGLRVGSCEVWSHNQTSMTTFSHF